MDPYKVLGVNPGDDEETIKKAYRALVKKYHPDRYVNTPMADMASEKMKEINEAYDMLTNKNTASQQGSYSGGYSSYNGNYSTASYANVRTLIAMRRFAEAEMMLQRLSQNAEWYYLMGLIYTNRGWYNKGIEYIKTALRLDPNNFEYRSTLNSIENNSSNYRDVVFTTNNSAACGICPSLCASWLCMRFFCCC